MIEVKEMKIHEVQAMNPKTPVIDTLTYRERNYPVREISDGRDTYKVSVERLNFDLLDGIRGLDPTAFDIDESICYFCTEYEIRTLTDEQLIELIYG